MKHVLSLALLFAAPALSAAAPATQAPMAEPAPPSIERQMLARQFVGLIISTDQILEGVRAMASVPMECGCDRKASMTKAEEAAADEQAEKDTKEFLALLEPKLRERVPNIMEAYAQYYAREFSADELKQMLAFAQSPVGHHYLYNQFKVQADPAVLIQQEGFMLDLLPAMQEFQKRKCQEHTAQLIAAGDKNAKCALTDKPDVAAG